MKFTLHKSLYLLFAFLGILTSCDKEYESIESIDSQTIQDYVRQNNLGVQQYKNTGIYYQIVSPGTGDTVKYTDRVFATFTVKSLDGKFSSMADTVNRFTSFLGYFSRNGGYPGAPTYPDAFSLAVKEILNKKNGTIRIIIPSHLAYGRDGNSTLNIPGNASLDCTIKLHDVANSTEFEDIFVKRYFQSSKIDISTFTRTSSGLYYKIINLGTDIEPVNEASLITVSYTGKLTNGTVFDQSTSYQAYLNGLIPGWIEAIPKIKGGGKIRLIIPPSLAYGGSSTGSVPPYSTLDFDIELLKVE